MIPIAIEQTEDGQVVLALLKHLADPASVRFDVHRCMFCGGHTHILSGPVVPTDAHESDCIILQVRVTEMVIRDREIDGYKPIAEAIREIDQMLAVPYSEDAL